MKFSIGFAPAPKGSGYEEVNETSAGAAPVRSLVRVHFPERGTTLSYYNDSFDLHPGDLVFVEGKLAGHRGRVVDVSRNFKIKLSDYKRVIGRADTRLSGRFHPAGSHLLTFDPGALPYEKALSWFKPPEDEEEYLSAGDGEAFLLSDLSGMHVSAETASRGHEYYLQNRISYLSVDGSRGRAIAEGSRPYELEFEYRGGEIRNLLCSCYCAGRCKHGFAAMLQLKELLERVEKDYDREYRASGGYFAAVGKETLFALVVGSMERGSLTFD